jgi:hypothetical protein
VDSGTLKVYQYAGAAGRTSGSQNATTSFALNPYDTNPQGIADPPVPAKMLPAANGRGAVSLVPARRPLPNPTAPPFGATLSLSPELVYWLVLPRPIAFAESTHSPQQGMDAAGARHVTGAPTLEHLTGTARPMRGLDAGSPRIHPAVDQLFSDSVLGLIDTRLS